MRSHRPSIAGSAALALLASAISPMSAQSPGKELVKPVAPLKASLFPLQDVRLLDSPFKDAMETDRAYLLKLDPDRLLAHMRTNAGLKAKAESYGGWDTGGSGTIGHYLSACALMAASTGDPALRKRVDYIVSQMAECQKAGDGGLYSFEWDAKTWFPELAKGHVIAVSTSAWYSVHKTMAGLRDAYLECGNQQARDVLVRISDWCINVTSRLTDAQWQEMLGAANMQGEFGAPHEILADVYAITGDRKYLQIAERFRHNLIFDPLSRGDASILNSRHANTDIPKFVGYERIYELTGDPVWLDASRNFWNDVTANRSWATGGNSQWEHFFNAKATEKNLTATCGPETCNTYNMLKLTRQLYTLSPSTNYVDFYERALYNSILPSEAPGGGFVYYTPMRPDHYRVFSRPFDAFWCCVGTGMENHGKYGEMIYAHTADRLFVNLFIPSVLQWKERGVTLRQETTFPEQPRTRLSIAVNSPKKLTLSVRCPDWIAGSGFKILINGKAFSVAARPGSYANITRTWKSGDHIDIALPMQVTPATNSATPDYASFYYGPILLAGALGDEGLSHSDFYGGGNNTNITNQLATRWKPLTQSPGLTMSAAKAAAQISPAPGHPLVFTAGDAIAPAGIRLEPLYKLPFQRYSIYWPTRTLYGRWKADERALQAATIDEVLVGNAQSESGHHMASDRSGSGPSGQEPYYFWRDAAGFFAYDLKSLPGQPVALQCAYWGGDKNRTFDIFVDGILLATQSLTGENPSGYVTVKYPIPSSITNGKSHITVRFAPKPGSTAGGVFDCRTMRG